MPDGNAFGAASRAPKNAHRWWLDIRIRRGARGTAPLFLCLLLAFSSFFAIYELFPKSGWADAAIYTGYALDEDAYAFVDGYGEALQGATYQASRLGHVLPLRWLSKQGDPSLGRLAYVSLLYGVLLLASLCLSRELLPDAPRGLAIAIVAFNPQWVSAIVAGGADGPAAVAVLVFAASIIASIQRRSPGFALLAGLAFAQALSCHVFAVVPMAIVSLVASLMPPRTRRPMGSGASFLLPIAFCSGTAALILLYAFAGHSLGLQANYLLYSLGRARLSLHGSGSYFAPPEHEWFGTVLLWWPSILVAAAAVRVLLKPPVEPAHAIGGPTWRRKGLCLLIVGTLPVVFVSVYDRWVGGSLSSSSHYASLFLPCFSVGLLLGVSTLAANGPVKRMALMSIVVAQIVSAMSYAGNASLWKASHVHSAARYASQVEFQRSVSSLARRQDVGFFYRAAGDEPKASVFVDYYKGSKRRHDFLDTLVNTFPWMRSRTVKVIDQPTSAQGVAFESKSVLFLASDADQLRELIRWTSLNVQPDDRAVKCSPVAEAKWCVTLFDRHSAAFDWQQ